MYLKKDIYPNSDNNYNLDLLDKTMQKYVGEQIHHNYKLQEMDLLPSPIFEQIILLEKNGENGLIDFRNLSSGERQIAYTISNFMYHLVNVDSEWNDYFHDRAHLEIIKYRYVNVIFDEVELYFHPEMQREFMGLLLQALQNAHFKNLRGVNIMLATHSPFILSDIPNTNVLCLGEGSFTVKETFGANIIEMLGNSFFLSSVIGNIATKELKALVLLYNKMQDKEDIKENFNQQRERLKYVVDIVSDEYLKNMANYMYYQLVKYNNKK
jgi:predicted ATP-binding protein involved in virulence